MTLGNASYSQWQPRLIVLQGDSVLVLEKPQAVVLSNSLTKKREFAERLKNSLKREAQMMAIWENTQAELEEQRELTNNIKEQLLNAENTTEKAQAQLKKTEALVKKSRRKSLITGLGLGAVAGFVTAVVLLD